MKRSRSSMSRMISSAVAFTPKGGCPLKLPQCCSHRHRCPSVAFTPKGGCPLKHKILRNGSRGMSLVAFTPKGGCPLKLGVAQYARASATSAVAFTPKGGCPLKPREGACCPRLRSQFVAFTPKGGCPLKLLRRARLESFGSESSIHPQGWVPIETCGNPGRRHLPK